MEQHGRSAPFALLLLTMSSCGFTPLYGGGADQGVVRPLGQVTVAIIADRSGQILRDELRERLERSSGEGEASRYDLNVALSLGESDIAVDQQSASTRGRENGVASWTLKAQDAAHTVLAAGSAHALDGFDIINQQFFAADMSREQAIRRVDQALADQITQQLAVYFKQHRAA